jgi:hypothetical protein
VRLTIAAKMLRTSKLLKNWRTEKASRALLLPCGCDHTHHHSLASGHGLRENGTAPNWAQKDTFHSDGWVSGLYPTPQFPWAGLTGSHPGRPRTSPMTSNVERNWKPRMIPCRWAPRSDMSCFSLKAKSYRHFAARGKVQHDPPAHLPPPTLAPTAPGETSGDGSGIVQNSYPPLGDLLMMSVRVFSAVCAPIL